MTAHGDNVLQLEIQIELELARANADWLALGERLRLLKFNMMDDPKLPSASQGISHLICARLHNDFRSATMLAQRGYVLQSLATAATMLELAFTVGYIANDASLAKSWMEWSTNATFVDVRKSIAATYKHADQSNTTEAQEYRYYQQLCQAKHGNPQVFRRLGIEVADGKLFAFHGPTLTRDVLHASRLALWYSSRYLALGLAAYNDFYGIEPHSLQRSTEITACLDTLVKLRNADIEKYEKPAHD